MPHRNIFAEEAVLKELAAPAYHSASSYGFDAVGTGKGVKIVIIDTGKPDHPSIKDAADFVNLATSHSALDTVGQATIVGGLINGNDTGNVYGMAPEADVYYAKISGDDGKVGLESFVSAFLYGLIKSVDIIIMPMTTDTSNDLFREVVAKAVSSNVCVICSAGMYGYTQYPAAYDGTLSVGALSQDGSRAGFSAVGKVNVVGTSITSTYVNQTYCVARGSAIATAIVGGLAALVVEEMKANGKVEPIKVYSQIEAITKGKHNV